MDKRFWRRIAIGLLCSVSLGASAELYKWVDTSGRVHYSDTEPHSKATELDYHAPADNRIAPPADIKYPKRRSKKSTKSKRRRASVFCEKYQYRIDKVQRQLRAGYKEPRGNKLRARKRELNEKLRLCRKGLS